MTITLYESYGVSINYVSLPRDGLISRIPSTYFSHPSIPAPRNKRIFGSKSVDFCKHGVFGSIFGEFVQDLLGLLRYLAEE
jgi:hypothetical protein